jgi:uncharacterized membrane protein YphA (DoxX/SURF4 family)
MPPKQEETGMTTSKNTTTRTKKVFYWLSTGLAGLALTAAGVTSLMRTPQMVATMSHLGYPSYVATILGTWKLLGVLAIVTPGFPRLKEWAYAGFFFDLTGAAMSHAASGDPVRVVIVPLVLLVAVMVSWALQPARGAFVAPKLKPAQAV